MNEAYPTGFQSSLTRGEGYRYHLRVSGTRELSALRVWVYGLVQGVGFRPFVYRIATEQGLQGWVNNTEKGVELKIQGPEKGIAAFLQSLKVSPPPLARIERIETREDSPEESLTDFRIVKSEGRSEAVTRVSPDVCVCDDCLSDMETQPNRVDYPFTNCTNCGPRFTIIRDLPYDRGKTTMESFTMCPSCQAEYEDITDRRFHAQPNACADCGPVCTFTGRQGSFSEIRRVLTETAKVIDGGGIAAVKAMGGFHLVCDALNEEAVGTLRRRKHREAKPFALMARDLETVRTFARVSGEEEALLTGARRPIVLLERAADPASSVAWGLDTLGVMLPCTPLQVLLFRYLKTPLIVATSGNLSEEPIVIDNREAFTRLGSVADAFLTYNRDIHNRCDDSIAMVARKIVRLIRRSRGYVPEPVTLNRDAEGIAAFGAELKNTFCIGKGREALVSQHIGDLKSAETFDFFTESYRRFGRLFRFTPTLGACDLHPDYLSTAFCLEQGLPVTRVQHHHAHIAACMAENRAEGPVIGVSFDGTGYGEDGAVWGGEFLLCDYASFTRYAHLQYVPLVGGDASVREPWRMALSWLYTCFGRDLFRRDIPFLRDLEEEKTGLFVTVLEKGAGSVPTSSVGRLFDALAAVLSLVKTIAFEAEGPMKLESLILPDDGVYPFRWGTSVDLTPLWEALLDDLARGVPPGVISCRFHNTLAEVVFQGVLRMAEETGVRQAALSGGVFQNRYFLSRTEELLEAGGFTLLTHRLVPANDGGVSLGQLAVAAARREEGLEP